MLIPVPAVTASAEDGAPPVRPLTAFAEDRAPAGLFTEPVDVSLLRELQVDECGRRSRWVPADCLL
jgi:hypothetical protein